MAKSDIKVTVTRPLDDYFIVDENHGGYQAGYCFGCKSPGWIEHLEQDPEKHKPNCPLLPYIPIRPT